jgi:ubiquinone/menaquinone biosynthesis C-methylase UbiE
MEAHDHTAINNAFFRRYAPIYDLLVFLLKRMRRRVVVLSGVSSGMKVLDVACGTGEQSLAFARNGAHVTVVDLSPDMLMRAKRKAHGLPVTFLEADATTLPFPDASFDITTISFALHDMPEDMGLAVLREMRRLTKPEGLVIIADYRPPRGILARLIHAVLGTAESRYYHHFITKGIAWYADQLSFAVTRREVRLGGAMEIVTCRF